MQHPSRPPPPLSTSQDPQAGTAKIAPPTILTTDEARQGVTGHNVRYVLAYSLAGTIFCFALIGLYFADR